MSHDLSHHLHNHGIGMIFMAFVVCCFGSALTFGLLMRARQVRKRRHIQLMLASMTAGTTIWAAHFLSMISFGAAESWGHDPLLVVTTLLVAIVGCSLTLSICFARRRLIHVPLAGITFAATIGLVHHIGRAAQAVPGIFIWEYDVIAWSLAIGAIFGTLVSYFIIYPVKRFRWGGGAISMVLTVVSIHFGGILSGCFVPKSASVAPMGYLSDVALGFMILTVVSLILTLGFATYLIQSGIETDAKHKLHRAATQDALTRLPNRLAMNTAVDAVTSRLNNGEDFRIAMLTIDLDLFKQINDLHGHPTGDALLVALSKHMQCALAPDEFLARTGGDEFIAIKTGYQRQSEVKAFAVRLLSAISEPISIDQKELVVSASIGISTYPEDGDDLQILLQNADFAMYRAKGETYHRICFYDLEMEEMSRAKLALLSDLRQAIARGEMFLNYQCQNDLGTLEIVGLEVLLRWQHPTRGLVPPDVFIPIAEESGLIRDIGLWVLRTACLEAASWSMPCRIAVNVAPQQLLQPSFVDHVGDILAESGLPVSRLELEITEASIIDDQKNTLDVMHRLKAMGIRIAMDDFGTGYSSLSTLQAFPFDKIKIDRSFIRDVHVNRQSAAIVRSTLLLGAALNVPVLAEGAENSEELAFLSNENCDQVQGFYFGRPMSVDMTRAKLAEAEDAKALEDEDQRKIGIG